MVEMLGVLAIIGVLSVGAIAGYSQAMFKYKLNKNIEQLSIFSMSVLEHYSGLEQGDDNTSAFIAGVAEALNIVPDGMKVSYPYIVDIFGNRFRPYIRNGSRRFVIEYYFNESGYFNGESEFTINTSLCPYLLTDFVRPYSNILYYTFIFRGEGKPSGSIWYGDKRCTNADRKCLNNMTRDDVYAMCHECIENSTCSLNIEFDVANEAQ